MRHRIAVALLVGFSLLLVGSARAERLGKGRSLVLVGIGGHTGEFVGVLPGLAASSMVRSTP